MAAQAPSGHLAASKPQHNALASGLVVVGAAMALMGCFLPWFNYRGFEENLFELARVSAGQVPGGGYPLAGTAIVSALLGVFIWTRRGGWVPSAALLVAAVVAMLVVVSGYHVASFLAAEGPGVYLSGLGLVVWVAGAIVSLVSRLKLI